MQRLLLLTLDSCRYDTLVDARTPTLDSYGPIVPAQTPGNFTYAAHQAFFVGLLPNASSDLPYYNRFRRQLIGLSNVGERAVARDARTVVESDWDMVAGLRRAGYQTVGAGAMNWFRQKALTAGFDRFEFTGRDADAQIDYLLAEVDPELPFFGFVNFGETHNPFTYAGKTDVCPVDVRARRMTWPPTPEGPVGKENGGYWHQVAAAEFIDGRLARLFSSLPGDTVTVVCADHGECFGEDGFWGHGVNHPKVLEVPLLIFRLDRQPLV